MSTRLTTLPTNTRNGDSVLPIHIVTLAMPMLVLRSKVGNISPMYRKITHAEDVMKRRLI